MRSLPPILALLLAACGSGPVRTWRPSPDASAERAVLYLSSECSGTLVAPTSVVTAAHCVEEDGPWWVRADGREVAVIACAVHPQAYGEPRDCGAGRGRTDRTHDLAVLELEEPIDGIPPVPVLLTDPQLRTQWWRGLAVRLVGWDRRPRIVGPLERRSGLNEVVAMRGASFVTAPPVHAGFHTIIGDSGGPALVRIEGTERVMGVLRGGPAVGAEASVYAATFHPDNARWLLEVLPPGWAQDLPPDLASEQ